MLYAAVNDDILRDSWILDSGANVYIINNLDYLVDFKRMTLDVSTVHGKGSMQVLGKATIELPLMLADGSMQTNYTIHECLCVLSSRCNLILPS